MKFVLCPQYIQSKARSRINTSFSHFKITISPPQAAIFFRPVESTVGPLKPANVHGGKQLIREMSLAVFPFFICLWPPESSRISSYNCIALSSVLVKPNSVLRHRKVVALLFRSMIECPFICLFVYLCGANETWILISRAIMEYLPISLKPLPHHGTMQHFSETTPLNNNQIF